jgi:hypothetical protein
MTWQEAEVHLKAWQAADLAVSTGQSYSLGSRSLTRANIADIRQQIAYWEKKVLELQTGRRGARVMRAVPRDL